MPAFDELIERADRAVHSVLGAQEITYAPTVGAPVPVTGIFDEQYVLVGGELDARVAATGPAFFCRRSDLPAGFEEDRPTLTIETLRDGIWDFEVTEFHPDGVGGVLLVLRRIVT